MIAWYHMTYAIVYTPSEGVYTPFEMAPNMESVYTERGPSRRIPR